LTKGAEPFIFLFQLCKLAPLTALAGKNPLEF
jgi:hypothetical protein